MTGSVLFAYLAKVACFLEGDRARTAHGARLFGVHLFPYSFTFVNGIALLRESPSVDVLSVYISCHIRLYSKTEPCLLGWLKASHYGAAENRGNV